MKTAHSLQLLDEQNNNISPMVNIESIYFEESDPQTSLVYRKHIYTHFPVYVKYNNNIDHPYRVNTGNDTGYAPYEMCSFASEKDECGEVSKRWECDNPLGLDSILTADSSHIKVSSVVQKAVGNTKYKMLDITTYDLSDMLYMYAPKQWANDNITRLDTRIDEIKYDSNVINSSTSYTEDPEHPFDPEAPVGFHNDPSYLYTTAELGHIAKGTNSYEFNHLRYTDLFDMILFKRNEPELVDVSVFNTCERNEYKVTYADVMNATQKADGNYDTCHIASDVERTSQIWASVGSVDCDGLPQPIQSGGSWKTDYTTFNTTAERSDESPEGYDVFNITHKMKDQPLNQLKRKDGDIVLEYETQFIYSTKTFATYDKEGEVRDNLNTARPAKGALVGKRVTGHSMYWDLDTETTVGTSGGAEYATCKFMLKDYTNVGIPVFFGPEELPNEKTSIVYIDHCDGEYDDDEYYMHYGTIELVMTHDQSKHFNLMLPAQFFPSKKPVLTAIDNYGVWEKCFDKLNPAESADKRFLRYTIPGDGASGKRDIKIKFYVK